MYGFERENRTEDASRPENRSKCANNYVHLNDSFSCPMNICTKEVVFVRFVVCLFVFCVCVFGFFFFFFFFFFFGVCLGEGGGDMFLFFFLRI